MKKVLAVTLAVASIASVIQIAGHSKTVNQNVMVADGSDPMPLCRKAKPPLNCPQVGTDGR